MKSEGLRSGMLKKCEESSHVPCPCVCIAVILLGEQTVVYASSAAAAVATQNKQTVYSYAYLYINMLSKAKPNYLQVCVLFECVNSDIYISFSTINKSTQYNRVYAFENELHSMGQIHTKFAVC